MVKKGLFITLEGLDGCGKSTVAAGIVEKLDEMGYEVLHTREPGGVKIAENIRDVILNPLNTSMDGKTEALLYAASRRQHLVEKVTPALIEGKIVVCERYIDSSLAYQGYARGIGIKQIMDINMFAMNNEMPDLTIYLDIPASLAQHRLAEREIKDRLDQEKSSFHYKVAEGYQEVLKMFPDRIKVVNAYQGKEEVLNDAMAVIDEFLKQAVN